MTGESKQLSLNANHPQTDNGLVVCLGMTFKNDDERREYFRNELRKKLPELKKIEGFPIGDDEDIIALSDPPYYTACPNPWINDFIEEWEKEKVTKYGRNLDEEYHREPFTSDVSEGKSDPIYNAHPYHTKVPPKAILRYLLHYTKPGDIVFDGFCGTGMTGVAANLCSNQDIINKLGYVVNENRFILNKSGIKISELGARKAIIGDLSPIATFISSNYNLPKDINAFKNEAEGILIKIEKEYGWMYETQHTSGSVGKINYVVWSEVFVCPQCSNDIVFYDVAAEKETGKVRESFLCPHCKVNLRKKELNKAWETKLDYYTKETIQQVKLVPVLINYTYAGKKYYKKLDGKDYDTIIKIDSLDIPFWFPTLRMPKGDEARRNDRTGITHIHHFYSKRNLFLLSVLKHYIEKSVHRDVLLLLFTSQLINISKLNRYRPGVTFPYNPLSGTLYIGSLISESNIFDAYKNKINKLYKALFQKEKNVLITTNSQTTNIIKDNTIDYIFTDPPFGENIMYSELSFIWESWLGILTNNKEEAIINKTQSKLLVDYKKLMEVCFKEYYRVLKPGKWITIEFSNSKASVWNAIQDAIQKAGFVISNVSGLDKQQGSFKAVTTTTAVKQDLVISAYKPKNENIEKIKREMNSEEAVWTFVTQHLEQLPVFLGIKGEAQIIPERSPRILFDRMVAYFVQNGIPVPLSSSEFQAGVIQRFPMRDGMAFLENQVAEYDRKRTLVKEFTQLNLFVSDENSAIEWIRQQLMKKPQTRQDLHPNFMKVIQHIAKHEELPELDDLLEQNFIRYDGEGPVPNQILTYIRRNYKDLRGLEPTDPNVIEKALYRWYVPDPNKQADLEKLREKALLREFDDYVKQLKGNKKKLRTFRTEAIRAGFKKAYKEKDFERIVKVGDRIPENVIQEDDKLFMFYENARVRLGI